MKHARINLAVGAIALIVAVAAALGLGITFDAHGQRDGLYVFTVARFFVRFAHTHGMPLALYNLIVGLALLHLPLSRREARATSWGAVLTLSVPLVMALKGAAGAPPDFPHIEIIGILGLIVSAALVLRGALRLGETEPASADPAS